MNLKKGISIERATNKKTGKINPEFMCFCCKKIIFGVHKCKNCEVYYCENCAIKKINYQCLNCKSNQITNDISQKKLKELSYYRFFCPNYKNGCTQKLFFEIYPNHLNKCLYEPMICFFPDCNEVILRRKYADHIKVCSHRFEICEYCQKKLNIYEIENHFFECPKREVQCLGCNKFMMNEYLKLHIEICQKTNLICDDCETYIDKNYPLNHNKTNCISLQMKNYYYDSSKKILEIKNKINSVLSNWNNLQNFIKSECVLCKKKSCEVALKNCAECKHKFCSCCAKKTFMNCKICTKIFCKPCFDLIKSNIDQVCKNCNEENQ